MNISVNLFQSANICWKLLLDDTKFLGAKVLDDKGIQFESMKKSLWGERERERFYHQDNYIANCDVIKIIDTNIFYHSQ